MLTDSFIFYTGGGGGGNDKINTEIVFLMTFIPQYLKCNNSKSNCPIALKCDTEYEVSEHAEATFQMLSMTR